MPAFEDLGAEHPSRFAAADAWRAVHAPPRVHRIQTPVASAPADSSDGGREEGEAGSGGRIDVERFDVKVDDFDGWAVKSAERMHKIAVGLYEEACARGDSVAIANATRNLADVARRSKQIREDFAKLRERARETINIDRAADLVSLAMNLFIRRATGMGQRLGILANPQDPALAQRVIDAELDRLFAQVDDVLGSLEEARTDEPAVAAA